MARRRTRIDTNGAPWESRFLKRLALCGNIREACVAAKVDRALVYRQRNAAPAFAQAMAQAIEDADDRLEQEARRRAVGKKQSDKLLMFLLRVRRYPVQQHEISGRDGGPIKIVRFGEAANAAPEVAADPGQ